MLTAQGSRRPLRKQQLSEDLPTALPRLTLRWRRGGMQEALVRCVNRLQNAPVLTCV